MEADKSKVNLDIMTRIKNPNLSDNVYKQESDFRKAVWAVNDPEHFNKVNKTMTNSHNIIMGVPDKTLLNRTNRLTIDPARQQKMMTYLGPSAMNKLNGGRLPNRINE